MLTAGVTMYCFKSGFVFSNKNSAIFAFAKWDPPDINGATIDPVIVVGGRFTTLNGANAVPGQALPASGVLATRFTDCVDAGIRYNGSASATMTRQTTG